MSADAGQGSFVTASGDRATDLRSVAHLDGLPMTASFVRNGILEQEKK